MKTIIRNQASFKQTSEQVKNHNYVAIMEKQSVFA